MKICYVGDAGSIHMQRWVKYFADKGHDVCLISPRPWAGDMPKNIRLDVLKMVRGVRFINNLLAVFQIRRIIGKIRPDILHAHHVTSSGFWSALSGFNPFVLTAWGSDIVIQPKKSRLVRRKAVFALERAQLITCDADHMVDRMIELGAVNNKIKVIYFGVDTKKFSGGKEPEPIKSRLKIPSDSPVVISLRNLNPIYDLETLIKAIPLVLEQVPQTRFIIAGDGEQKDYLRNLAISLGVQDRTLFVGSITGGDMPRYLASADVYVSTSLSDAGLAASTAEAMACELPVVITDFGDNKSWVYEGKGGFLFPLKSSKELAEKITYLLKNEEARISFGRFNRGVIMERNDYYSEMGKVEKFYQELLAR